MFLLCETFSPLKTKTGDHEKLFSNQLRLNYDGRPY